MKQAILFILLSSLTFLTINCSRTVRKNPNKDLVSYPGLRVTLDPSMTPPVEILHLAERLNADKVVSFNQITELIVRDHILEFNKLEDPDVDNNVGVLLSLLSGDLRQVDVKFLEAKPKYEGELLTAQKNQFSSFKYNKDKISLIHPLQQGKLQCYSGTMLNLVLHRKKYWGQDYRPQEFVNIFTEGHVQPGQMIQKNGKWYLFAIETTVDGRGLRYFGEASTLDDGTHVYLSEHMALAEVFKKYMKPAVSGSDSVYWWMRQQAATRYGIPLPKSPLVIPVAVPSGSPLSPLEDKGSQSSLNASPMAFGVASVSAGDQDRPLSGAAGVGATHGGIPIDDQVSLDDIMKNPGAFSVNGAGGPVIPDQRPNKLKEANLPRWLSGVRCLPIDDKTPKGKTAEDLILFKSDMGHSEIYVAAIGITADGNLEIPIIVPESEKKDNSGRALSVRGSANFKLTPLSDDSDATDTSIVSLEDKPLNLKAKLNFAPEGFKYLSKKWVEVVIFPPEVGPPAPRGSLFNLLILTGENKEKTELAFYCQSDTSGSAKFSR